MKAIAVIVCLAVVFGASMVVSAPIPAPATVDPACCCEGLCACCTPATQAVSESDCSCSLAADDTPGTPPAVPSQQARADDDTQHARLAMVNEQSPHAPVAGHSRTYRLCESAGPPGHAPPYIDHCALLI